MEIERTVMSRSVSIPINRSFSQTGSGGLDVAPLVDALRKMQFNGLVVQDSTVRMKLADGSLVELENDHDFLLQGDVFTRDALEMWIDYKREHEIARLRQYPAPIEYEMYYDL